MREIKSNLTKFFESPLPKGYRKATQKEIKAMKEQDIKKLCETVDKFAGKMKAKLKLKVKTGFRGWDTSGYRKEDIDKQLARCLVKLFADEPEAVDIANLAMFWAYQNNELF